LSFPIVTRYGRIPIHDQELANKKYVDNQVGSNLGDLKYIESKVLSGDYFQVSGDIDALTDTIEYIPANGKTAFIIEAKIVSTGHATPPAMGAGTANTIVDNRVEAVLKINTVIKDTTNVGFMYQATSSTNSNGRGAGGGVGNPSSKFQVIGISLVGDGAKKIEVENSLDNGTAFATLSGYLIDT